MKISDFSKKLFLLNLCINFGIHVFFIKSYDNLEKIFKEKTYLYVFVGVLILTLFYFSLGFFSEN